MKGLNKISNSKNWWLFLLIALFLLNYLASVFHARLDLTKEKRYTLSSTTSKLLKTLDDDLQIDVFLKGEFPAGFRKLANSTRDFLGVLKDKNSSKVHYRFISPQDEIPGTSVLYGDSLTRMGAIPINLTVQKEAGESSNIIFPVAALHYKGKSSLVSLYPGANRTISNVEINSAEALMEYQFVKTLDKLVHPQKQGIAYATGNGQPVDARTFNLVQTVSADYDFKTLNLNTPGAIPPEVRMLMIVKPSESFSESAKLKIDQFVMNGGKLLCFIDNLIAEQDSLQGKSSGETIAYDRNLNLTDLFFKYGVRINTDLVMDLQCDFIPVIVGGTMENPQMEFLRWNYFPVLTTTGRGAGVSYIGSRFANSIDTISTPNVKKIVLLVSSANSRTISTPALISLNENKNVTADEKFNKSSIPVAMLLDGKFSSLYRNRLTKAQADSLAAVGMIFRDQSVENKMIVVADGDIVLNDLLPDGPIDMGWNKYTYTEYLKETEKGKLFFPVANRDFLISCIETLISEPGISQTKNKEIVLRLLNSQKVRDQKTTWQFMNIGLPVLLVLIFGVIYQQVRKRKYAA